MDAGRMTTKTQQDPKEKQKTVSDLQMTLLEFIILRCRCMDVTPTLDTGNATAISFVLHAPCEYVCVFF